MDIVDFIIYVVRYTPLFLLTFFAFALLYLQIKEARGKNNFRHQHSRR